jgi:methionyl-tRNA synthetase
MKKTLVIATPPTPNGDLHIGHLSGPYLRADIYTRYLKMLGAEVYYFTGTDDHQSYVAYKAKQVGLTCPETAAEYGDEMMETLKAAGIAVDHYARPRQSRHHIPLAQDFIKKLASGDNLIAKDAPSLFCEVCNIYLYEVHVRGKCPHCGSMSNGNACEDCGRPNDCIDLQDAICNHCGNKPAVRSFKRLYFPLRKFEKQLREYYDSVEMNPHMRVLCDQMLEDGLPDISISHIADWGIAVPMPEYLQQIIYVWFEMAPGFLAATQELCEKTGKRGWEDFWKDDDADVVQFFGFDNAYFFAVLFPAIFSAYDSSIRLPRHFVMNEFYRLDGLKFSTSRNHAIWGRELLKSASVDAVRFYLSYSGPETDQTNFTVKDFQDTAQRELINGWQVWLNELGDKVASQSGGGAPEPGVLTAEQNRFRHALKSFAAEVALAYEAATFSPRRATRAMCGLVSSAHRFAKAEDHWSKSDSRRSERRTAIALELLAAKTLALLSAPVMPDFSSRLRESLGYTGSMLDGAWNEMDEWVPAGMNIGNLKGDFF